MCTRQSWKVIWDIINTLLVTTVAVEATSVKYPPQNNVNKIAIKQPQTRNRNGPILTLKKTWRKKMCSV